MESKSIYRVVVAVAEKRNDEGEITREFEVIYDDSEVTTASKVKPVNIIRRTEIAEKLAGIPAEEVLVSVSGVTMSAPFQS